MGAVWCGVMSCVLIDTFGRTCCLHLQVSGWRCQWRKRVAGSVIATESVELVVLQVCTVSNPERWDRSIVTLKRWTIPARTLSVLLNMLSLCIATSSNPLPRARADSVFCGCHRRPLGLNNPRNFAVYCNAEWQELSDSWVSIQDSKFKHSQLWCCWAIFNQRPHDSIMLQSFVYVCCHLCFPWQWNFLHFVPLCVANCFNGRIL